MRTSECVFFFSSRRRHTRFDCDWSSDVCSSDLAAQVGTLPMMATDFHVLSPVAPIANALTLPILPILVASGLVLSVLSVAPELARVAVIPLTGLVASIVRVGYLLAGARMCGLDLLTLSYRGDI